jgi:hypothetical protein
MEEMLQRHKGDGEELQCVDDLVSLAVTRHAATIPRRSCG